MIRSVRERVSASPRFGVTLLMIAAIAASVIGAFLTPDFWTMHRGELGLLAALAAGFGVCQQLSFHIEGRTQAVTHTPTELVLAVGLVAASPLGLVIASAVGLCLGLVVRRRRLPLQKLLFNVVASGIETIVALAVYRNLVDGSPAATPWDWVALAVAISAALLVTAMLVDIVISLFEGELRSRLVTTVRTGWVRTPAAVLGACVGVGVLFAPWMLVVALSPAPLIWFVIRENGALMHRYNDMTLVYDFAGALGGKADPRDLAMTAVSRLAESLRADQVLLRIWDADGTSFDVGDGDAALEAVTPEPAQATDWSPDDIHRPRWVSAASDEPGADGLAASGLGGAFVTLLGDERGPLGALVVAGRHGARADFDDDDRTRMGGMAQQLSMAMRKAQFHTQLQFEATHDRLTGLPNRRYFEAWIDGLMSTDATRRLCVLMVNLDGFKDVNDAFGLAAGDHVLRVVAGRLRQRVPESGVVARLSADEFAILLVDTTMPEAVEHAQELASAVEGPMTVHGSSIAVGVSLGIAAGPDHGHEAARLMRHAGLAMNDAKSRRVRIAEFRDDLIVGDSVRVALLADLRALLEAEALEVYFQPKVEPTTSQVVGAEALVRWNHPERGFVNPEVFVGLAEQAGLIGVLTAQVMDRALRAAAEWHRRGWMLSVSVNVSAMSLVDDDLPVLVAESLRRRGVRPRHLTLEITESTVVSDAEQTRRILERLNELGVGLSVDDFGTGFSSLVNLRDLPVHEIKIDRSFVASMLQQNSDEVIVRSTIDLGHNLGLVVVAEGAEDEATIARLGELGCDLVQGYGISRPLPPGEFVHWVATARAAAAQRRVEGPGPQVPAVAEDAIGPSRPGT